MDAECLEWGMPRRALCGETSGSWLRKRRGGGRERERETEGAVVKLRWNVIVAGFFERRATGQKDENVTAPKFHKDGWLARERREEWLQSMQRRWKRV